MKRFEPLGIRRRTQWPTAWSALAADPPKSIKIGYAVRSAA